MSLSISLQPQLIEPEPPQRMREQVVNQEPPSQPPPQPRPQLPVARSTFEPPMPQRRPQFSAVEPAPRVDLLNPRVGIRQDPAIPDRKPTAGVARDTPESRMALSNEARIESEMRRRKRNLLGSRMSLLDGF